jgi:hypothetical protein
MSEMRDYFAYFDEGGTHDTDERQGHSNRPNAISEKYGFDIFHAVDVRDGKGVFRGSSPQKKLSLRLIQ